MNLLCLSRRPPKLPLALFFPALLCLLLTTVNGQENVTVPGDTSGAPDGDAGANAVRVISEGVPMIMIISAKTSGSCGEEENKALAMDNLTFIYSVEGSNDTYKLKSLNGPKFWFPESEDTMQQCNLDYLHCSTAKPDVSFTDDEIFSCTCWVELDTFQARLALKAKKFMSDKLISFRWDSVISPAVADAYMMNHTLPSIQDTCEGGAPTKAQSKGRANHSPAHGPELGFLMVSLVTLVAFV